MARKGENIYKRKDGRWEGRYKSGCSEDGKTKYSSVYGRSYTEVREKVKTNNSRSNKKRKDLLYFCCSRYA